MISNSKKDLEKLEIYGMAKSIAWSDLSQNDKVVYVNEAKKIIDNKDRPHLNKNIYDIVLDLEAKRTMWKDLEAKERKSYTSKAQRVIFKVRGK